jgi:hypothetical protein
MVHFYAIAERGTDGWYLTFPGGAGYSYAASPDQIVAQARDWLASAAMAGSLPHSIEDGARPPSEADLADYDHPLVVVVPFEPATVYAVA